MEFKDDTLGYRCTVKDSLTALDLLTYDSVRMEKLGNPSLIVLWEMAKVLIDEWECEIFPNYRVDLATVNGEHTTQIVKILRQVGVSVSAWRRSLDEPPKN
jgi:hypothetical protein